MKKILIILILILSVFSVANAHPFKSEKELYDYYAEIDKKIFTEKNKPIIRKKYPRKLTDKELEQEQIPFSLKRYTVDEIVGNNKLVYNAFNYQLMSISQINKNNKEEGVIRTFDEDENLISIAYIENSKGVMGIYREYYPWGVLKNETPYYTSEINGKLKNYYPDGLLKEEYTYYNNKKEGLATMYYESGQKFAIENYKNDLKNGDYYMYYENGNLGMKAFFVNGKREGTIEFYEEDGKKIEKNK